MQKRFKRAVIAQVMVAFVAAELSGAAFAAELPDGTVISKENLDKIKNDTFMGHTIASLLTEKVEWQIRNWNIKLPLKKGKEPEMNQAYLDATKKHSGQVKFDPQTREVSGYVAGTPFPNISESDPAAGEKILWNWYYGKTAGDSVRNENVIVAVGKNGYESSSVLLYEQVMTKGRLNGPASIGDPGVLSHTFIVNTAPEDVKGTGVYTVRYDAKKQEDSWAYIKSARRIRRLSGNNWIDPIGGLDQLYDDAYIYNARPSIYTKNRLLGKRWILAASDFKPEQVPGKKATAEHFKHFDTQKPLFGITKDIGYTPREVWIVEGTPPSEHPYSKKIVYVDTKIPTAYMGEYYDKKGDYWRHIQFHYVMKNGATSGLKHYAFTSGNIYDFKRGHATLIVAEPSAQDFPGAVLNKYRPEALENFQ